MIAETSTEKKMNKNISNYDKFPVIPHSISADAMAQGWDAICGRIAEDANSLPGSKKIIVLECYQGLLEDELLSALHSRISGKFFYTKDAWQHEDQIARLVYPDVTDDEVFGFMTRLEIRDFFDKKKLAVMRKQIDEIAVGNIILVGPGASLLVDEPALVVYFDMPRWEIQLRFRKDLVGNLGLNNSRLKASLQYKHAFFVDWRVCDKHKKTLMKKWDWVVDTTIAGQPKMVKGVELNNALGQLTTRPFRLVPFFDPGPWGGQWMKEVCDLDRSEANYAWAFDCVPEENSLLFSFNEMIFETPGINLVFAASKELLGEAVQARFGDEFPIRFDFLDTMDGGNLSLQVHPTTEYAREHFGINYTQDESYYMLDAGSDACVYLGFKDDTRPEAMLDALRKAQSPGTDFNADKFAAKWPVKKHDHVLIPAGTIHCSGKNSMVLEISATPYIFTFKLWDWGRMGLDGKPRPINIEHGKNVLDWTRTTDYTKSQLINTIKLIGEGDGWKEEYTGLHEREFIETRRHWFSKAVHHVTGGSVNVLNLVEGAEAIVESPDGAFEPFAVHYAETFVVPAAVQEYTIRPYGAAAGMQCATIKAFVRSKG